MMEKYVNGDNDLTVCFDTHSENWEENYLAHIYRMGWDRTASGRR